MTETTPLDIAHAAMQANETDPRARLKFYQRLAESELFLLLEKEAGADGVSPELFPLEGVPYALVFDREERLADFARRTVAHLALSGRAAIGLLAGEGIGLGVNPGVAASSILIAPDAVDWLASALAGAVHEARERPLEIAPAFDLPEPLLAALAEKLALAGGLARAAWVANVTYANGTRATLLAIVDARPGAEGAIRQAVSEAVVFAAPDSPDSPDSAGSAGGTDGAGGAGNADSAGGTGAAGSLDLAFFCGEDGIVRHIERAGIRIALADPARNAPENREAQQPAGPGMDPARPPRIR